MAGDPHAESTLPAGGECTQGVVVFTVGRQRYGLRIECVREILRLERLTPVYRADRWLRGVTNLRGQVVAVCDLIDFLGLGALAATTGPLPAVVVTAGGREMLVLVESVPAVSWVAPDTFNTPPATMPDRVRVFIEAVLQEPGGQPVALLDVVRILDDERWSAYRP